MICNSDRDIVSSGMRYRVEIVKMCIVWEFDLRRYPDSTGTLDSTI